MAFSCQIPRLKKFLGCYSLATGSLIISWYCLIISSMELVTTGILYTNIMDYVEKQLSNYTSQESQDIEANVLLAKITIDLLIAMLCLGVVISSLLLVGVYKGNTCLMLPWILINGAGCTFSVISAIFSLFSLFSSFEIFLTSVAMYFFIALQVYTFLVVYSFYCELTAHRNITENTPLSTAGSSYHHYHVLS